MFRKIMQSFLPWILFFILMGDRQQQLDIAIIVATATFIIFEFRSLKQGFILSWGTLIFFIFMFIAVVLFKNKWVATYAWILSNCTLAAIAWISILIRKPFTIQYAREQIAQDKWQHPLFLKINSLLTTVWGLIFLIGIGLYILRCYKPLLSVWIFGIIAFLPTIFGVWFSTWFPNWYKEKYLREHT